MSDVLAKLRSVQSFCDESGRHDLGQVALEAIDVLNVLKKQTQHMANLEDRVDALQEDKRRVFEACQGPENERRIFTKLLREHGIGILTLEELKAQTLAVARGELKLPPDEPKLSFSSIEVLIGCIKRDNPLPDTNLE